ncbi:MAG: hypothetical protein F6K30_27195, partial [Cyanothece sp. SIO2G6]|nr:hypothetical protein [Cyanothece sp. SIO2G6]
MLRRIKQYFQRRQLHPKAHANAVTEVGLTPESMVDGGGKGASDETQKAVKQGDRATKTNNGEQVYTSYQQALQLAPQSSVPHEKLAQGLEQQG